MPAPVHPAHRAPGRHTHWRLTRRRHLLLRGGAAATLLAVVGPGLLAELSDDDPAGIATYSILALGRKADLDDKFDEARSFYLSYGATGVALAAIAVSVSALVVL